MKRNVFLKAGILLLSLLLLPGLSGCGAISSLMATPTPTMTPTPTATSTPTMTPSPVPTPTPKFFVIRSKDFDQGEDCFKPTVLEPTVLELSQKAGQSDISIKIVSGSLTIKKSQFIVFCYEAKHIWIGTVAYAGYTFISDKDNPLQFQVVRDKGYVYIQGKGTVKMPDGTVVDLP